MDWTPDELAQCTGFEWDEGNMEKNWELHGVSAVESEQVFFQRPILIARDPLHSQDEFRYSALGKTVADRELTIVF
ncbi:MAG: BrnT family toxin, partial [Gemmatimonadales bacterium]